MGRYRAKNLKIGEISCFKFPTQNLCRPSLVMRIYVYIFSIFLVHKFFQGCSNLFNYGPIDCGNVISISATQTVRIEEKKRTLSVIGPQLSMSPITLDFILYSLLINAGWINATFLTQKQGHNAVLPVVVDFYYHFGGNVFVNKLALLRHHLLKALPKSHCKQINRRDTGL